MMCFSDLDSGLLKIYAITDDLTELIAIKQIFAQGSDYLRSMNMIDNTLYFGTSYNNKIYSLKLYN